MSIVHLGYTWTTKAVHFTYPSSTSKQLFKVVRTAQNVLTFKKKKGSYSQLKACFGPHYVASTSTHTHKLLMQTLQFSLGWVRLFCGQEPAVISLAQSSGLFPLFYQALLFPCSITVIETDPISFSHTQEKGCVSVLMPFWVNNKEQNINQQ